MFKQICYKLYKIICSKLFLSKPMIHEYANYANKIICLSDHEIKCLCLSFYLTQILKVIGRSCNIIDLIGTPPLLNEFC